MRSKFALFTVLAATASVAGISLSAGATTYYASPSGSDTASGAKLKPWRTLLRAKKTMKPGDTLLIGDGVYAGVRHNVNGLQGKPITYKAINSGQVILDGSINGDSDVFTIMQVNWIVVDGLVMQGGSRTGVWVAASDHVIVRNCIARNNGVQGILSGQCDDLLIENCECAFNTQQHGIYVSEACLRPIVRNNSLHDNGRCGLQLNATGMLASQFPNVSGKGFTDAAVIDGNVIYNNGVGGGAGINLASVRNSAIVNNLLYDNQSGGIALFNDGSKNAVNFGSKYNLIASNTVYFRPTDGRWCLSFKNGSVGNIVQDNILAGGARGAYEFDDVSSFSGDYNLVNTPYQSIALFVPNGTQLSCADYQRLTGNDKHSHYADPLFANPTGPAPDFHLQAASPARHAGVSVPGLVYDADGYKIPARTPDLGCYAAGALSNSVNN